MTWAVAILGLAFLVLIHEAGHFFTARAVGMTPRRFYIGFPPALVKKVHNGVEYGLGALPLGGYVKIPGMHRPSPGDLDVFFGRAAHEAPELCGPVERMKRRLVEGDFDRARVEFPALEGALDRAPLATGSRRTAERGLRELRDGLGGDAYWRQATWKRLAVIFAGPATNLVFAVVLLAVVYMIGVRVLTLGVAQVETASPAEISGLRAGDRVVAVDNKPVADFDEVYTTIQKGKGDPVRLTVVRKFQTLSLQLTPTKEYRGDYKIGFRPMYVFETYSPPDAVGLAATRSWEVSALIAGGFARLVTGSGTDEVASTYGIVRYSERAVEADIRVYLQLLAFISLSLALLNLLPLLPLDGGHMAFSLIEAVRRRAVGREVYERDADDRDALVLTLFFIGLSNDLGGGGPG